MLIRIIGAGCPACEQLEADVRQWLSRHRVEAQVERIDDLIAILNYTRRTDRRVAVAIRANERGVVDLRRRAGLPGLSYGVSAEDGR